MTVLHIDFYSSSDDSARDRFHKRLEQMVHSIYGSF